MAREAAAVCACALVVALGIWRYRTSSPCSSGLPSELRSARLVYAEHQFRSAGILQIVAKLDRAYCNAAGELVLVELKTRAADRVYESDVIELSAQRVALMAQTQEAVAGHAYVFIQRPDGYPIAWHRVRLLEPLDVSALALRRQELLAGKAEPWPSCSPGLCRDCGFVQRCDPPPR